MSIQTTYWGIFCRVCMTPVAFDASPYHQSAIGVLNLRPGAIRCANGHNHIYFPRDFCFFTSELPINDTILQDNCTAHMAINPAPQTLARVSR